VAIGSVLSDGVVLGDRYVLEERLGIGGMASVWLAQDERLARPVAVKVIADTLAADRRYRERFAREARVAASLSHPGIVPIYDYTAHGERPFLVMEYVPGGSLADLFAGRRSMAFDSTELARWLLGALDCVHRAGLVHRDVKPGNVLLDASAHPRLTDFGVARPEDATALTQTGMVVGTLRYMPPEVAAGRKATRASDLYGAGVVLRELTEHQPAPELSGLIEALAEPEPENRPPSAAAARKLLEAEDPATAARAPSTRSTAATRPLRRPAGPARAPQRVVMRSRGFSPRALMAALVALIVVVAVVLSVTGGGSSPPKRPSVGQPAPAGAPLQTQLQALGQLVDQARR
jgi:serine/threonine protein kinase